MREILADSYSLKRYYNIKVPKDVEHESEIWHTVIKSHEENFKGPKLPTNSVMQVMPTIRPAATTDVVPNINHANYNQMNWFTTSPYFPGFGSYYQPAYGTGFMPTAISSPPPPTPDDEEPGSD